MNESEPLYGVKLTIRSTGALTFRRMPSAILHISTYAFIPPTTLSGWLRRLCLISTGVFPDTDIKNPDYLIMPQSYHVLGAYPNSINHAKGEIHTTKRQGVRSFNHDAFSRISGGRGKKEIYQLHSWEYLMTEHFVGFVLHREAAHLEGLQRLINFGCKCGKEGYAFLEDVSPVQTLRRLQCWAVPSTPITGSDLLSTVADMVVCYRHVFKAKQPLVEDPFALEPSQVEGYQSMWLGWPHSATELDYFTDNESWYIPTSMVEVL